MKLPRPFAPLAAAVAFAAAAVTTTAAEDAPEGSPDFEDRYAAALKKAEKEGKPVIVVFSAAWCGPCQVNKKTVYPSDAVKPFHDKFVWAYLDTDDQANHPAAKKFGVRGIPHIEFVGSDGKSLGKTVGSTTPDAFAEKLESVLAKAAPSSG